MTVSLYLPPFPDPDEKRPSLAWLLIMKMLPFAHTGPIIPFVRGKTSNFVLPGSLSDPERIKLEVLKGKMQRDKLYTTLIDAC